jgi:hypothetical protein
MRIQKRGIHSMHPSSFLPITTDLSHRRKNSSKARRLLLEQLENRRLLTVAVQDSLWSAQPLSAVEGIDGGPSYISASEYDLFHLDLERLKQQLDDAPLQFSEASELPVISLPTGDGFERFEVAYSPIYAAGFSADFPEIRTFAGRSLDQPGSFARLGVTYLGFHATVRSPSGGFEINPYFHNGSADLYTVYSTSDITRQVDGLPGALLHPDDPAANPLSADDGDRKDSSGGDSPPALFSPDDQSQSLNSGPFLRVYRIGISANSGYSQSAGGTMPAVQSTIVASLNRVNAITQTDASISFELIANNQLLTFLNAGNDPFTADNLFANLGENIELMNQVIGFDNFDIGHVYMSGGGGGLAYLRALGTPVKAGGVTTGVPSDRFDEVAAHELGHQLGSGHTFSGANGACGGNVTLSSSIEPGSGSTLMAYPGLCGADNIQNRFDRYYHGLSVQLFLAHLDGSVPGVGQRVPTGNQLPQVRALARSGLTIPARTPFILEAVATDGNNPEDITYTWEQFDIGPQKALSAGDDGRGAIIRSLPPTTESNRIIPRLSDLVNNTSRASEILPTTNRQLNFRVTARDNFLGAGAFDTDNVRITVVDTGQQFTVTTPNEPGIVWDGLSEQTIQWNVAGTNALPIGASHVTILLSTDGGFTYPYVLAERVPNSGQADVFLPNIATSQARIMVRGHNNIFFDISDTDFQIDEVPLVVTVAPSVSTYVENASPVIIASESVVSLVENMNGLTMEVNIASGQQDGDQLLLLESSIVQIDGDALIYSGQQVAVVEQTGDRLQLRFNEVSTPAALQATLRRVAFENVTDNPRDVAREVEFLFGGASRRTVQVNVQPTNDAPLISDAQLPSILEDTLAITGRTVGQLWDNSFVDPDEGAFLSGVAVIGNPQETSEGIWHYATGSVWVPIGNVDDGSNSLVLSRDTRLGFLPFPDYFGTPTPLRVRALDDSFTGSFSNVEQDQRVYYVESDPTSISPESVLLTITVINVNDPPVATIDNLNIEILQDQPINRQFPESYFVDIDSPLTWSLVTTDGSPLPAWLGFNPANRFLSGTPRNNDVGIYDLRIRATDGEFTASIPLRITVINVNDPPEQLRFVPLPVRENQQGLLVGTLFAIDPDGDSITWSVSDPRFSIQGNQVFLDVALDYETEQQVPLTFQASDNANPPLSASLQFALSVLDVNEFYPDLRGEQVTVPSGTLAGTLLKRLEAPDGDIFQTVRFRMLDGDRYAFELNETTGDLRLAVDVDSNQKSEYKVFVEAFDNGSPQFATTAQFTLQVTPVNQFPPVIDPNQQLNFPENLPGGSEIGRIIASDSDGTPLRYEVLEVVGGNLNWIQVQPQTGVLRVTTAHRFDFESGIEHALRVRVVETLDPFRSDEISIPIVLSDVNDPPIGLQPISILTSRMGAEAAPFIVIDQDPSSAGYSFSTQDPRFEIRNDRLALKPNQFFNSSFGGSTTSALIRVDDNGDPSSFANLTVNIQIVAAPAWQNPENALDVNRDGRISSLDALMIVNQLNLQQTSQLAVPRTLQQQALPDFDTNGDDRITAFDALLIINYLNSRNNSGTSGAEGESDGAATGIAERWSMAFEQLEDEDRQRKARKLL